MITIVKPMIDDLEESGFALSMARILQYCVETFTSPAALNDLDANLKRDSKVARRLCQRRRRCIETWDSAPNG
ncbi:MAG: hypothetical protein WBM14_08095, partial [Terracidiphilus sp.]